MRVPLYPCAGGILEILKFRPEYGPKTSAETKRITYCNRCTSPQRYRYVRGNCGKSATPYATNFPPTHLAFIGLKIKLASVLLTAHVHCVCFIFVFVICCYFIPNRMRPTSLLFFFRF